MKLNLQITPAAGGYYTQEQLYALCVLLCWEPGLSLPDDLAGKSAVTLKGVPKGNTGLSVYLLQNNPQRNRPHLFRWPQRVVRKHLLQGVGRAVGCAVRRRWRGPRFVCYNRNALMALWGVFAVRCYHGPFCTQ